MVKKIVNNEKNKVEVDAENINDFLGVKFKYGGESENKWNNWFSLDWIWEKYKNWNCQYERKMQITGKLGDVMQGQ